MQPDETPPNAPSDTVVVLGAGMVGVACALELQRRGLRVTLVDRREPGSETSFGNAGVLARSSLLPFNNPALWRALPRLLRNRSTSFRWRPGAVRPGWATRFLANARAARSHETAAALDGLIRLSMDEHLVLLADAGAAHRLREDGWLFLYRSESGFDLGAPARRAWDEFGVRTQALDAGALHDLEPRLRPIFPRATWVRDAWSVDDPGAVVAAYARLFAARGGQVVRRDVTALRAVGDGWAVQCGDAATITARRAVVALGPWSRDALAPLGLQVPMAFERGYHRHLAAADDASLRRPVYDTAGGYVMSPMARGLRLTTGVELAGLDDPPDPTQLDLAERAAREAFPLAARTTDPDWLGRRPTLPDSRPIVGAAPGRPGLWLAFGHQHIGFCTGPGTARLLGALMAGETPPIAAEPFRAGRYLR